VTTVRWLFAMTLIVASGSLVIRALDRTHEGAGPWNAMFARLRRDRYAVGAIYVIFSLVILALLASWLSPYPPERQLDIVALKNQPPSLRHVLGTDPYSRDVLSRLLYGARLSLGVGVLAMVLSITVGTAYGAVAGFQGGRLGEGMMRGIDAALSVPRILILIAILAIWGSVSTLALVMLIGLTGWFGVSRIVRAQVLVVRAQELVHAARSLGASDARVLWRHIFPNAISPVIVAATVNIGAVIVLESGLSYLGLGVQPPTASWGNIIYDGRDQVASHWWISLFPGLAIVLTAMAFNVLGDALRDALDPRQVEER